MLKRLINFFSKNKVNNGLLFAHKPFDKPHYLTMEQANAGIVISGGDCSQRNFVLHGLAQLAAGRSEGLLFITRDRNDFMVINRIANSVNRSADVFHVDMTGVVGESCDTSWAIRHAVVLGRIVVVTLPDDQNEHHLKIGNDVVSSIERALINAFMDEVVNGRNPEVPGWVMVFDGFDRYGTVNDNWLGLHAIVGSLNGRIILSTDSVIDLAIKHEFAQDFRNHIILKNLKDPAFASYPPMVAMHKWLGVDGVESTQIRMLLPIEHREPDAAECLDGSVFQAYKTPQRKRSL